jgi:hypothetical protein
MAAGALYYPYIRFRDYPWLLGSLLLWERVYRLVPTGYSSADPGARQQLEEHGIVVRLSAENEVREY